MNVQLRNRLKKAIDCLMIVLYIYLMSYRAGRGLMNHAVAGIIIFLLFAWHNFLNLAWYKAVFQGKYSPRRIFLTLINLSLLAAMLLMAISSYNIAGMVWSFGGGLDFRWAEIHFWAAAWGFLLLSVHLGFHTHGWLVKMKEKAAPKIGAAAGKIGEMAVVLFGLCNFSKSGLLGNLVFEHDILPTVTLGKFFLDYISIMAAVCLIMHWLRSAGKTD